MKLITEFYGKQESYDDLQSYALTKLRYDDYGIGLLEMAAGRSENNSKAIGRLLELLAAKGIINADDAVLIIDGYLPMGGSCCFS